jgi:hypothetical protein
LAPEQAKGGKGIDARIDIWSAGVMLYETISGSIPFDGDNYNEILGKILLEEPTPLGELVPYLPDGLVSVIEKALVKDRDQRYQNVTGMIEALLPFLDKKVGVLSAPVARALKESVDPPPFKLDNHRKVVLGKKKEAVSKSDSIAQMITTNALEIPGKLKRVSAKNSKRARVIMAVSAVIFLAVLVGLIFTFADRSEHGNFLAEPALESALFPNGEKHGSNQQSTREVEPNEHEKVTIQFHGLPEDAEVLLDDKAFVPPIEVVKSHRSKRLNVSAPGYILFSQEVIADEDKTLEISMKKKRKRSSRSSTISKKKVQTEATQERRGEVWTRNPFAK